MTDNKGEQTFEGITKGFTKYRHTRYPWIWDFSY